MKVSTYLILSVSMSIKQVLCQYGKNITKTA